MTLSRESAVVSGKLRPDFGIQMRGGCPPYKGFGSSMTENKCRLCVGEFLKGKSECSHCGSALSSPVGVKRDARIKSANDIFASTSELFNFESSSDREENDLESVLFDWRNPIAIHIVGSLVCALILIATLLEL